VNVGLGFIGAGNHARHHMKEFAQLPGAVLVRVVDIRHIRAEEAAHDFSPLRVSSTLAELLADSDVDAVVIATPAESHRELVEAALAAGKHILLEKPMAHTPEDALAIANAAAAHPELVLLVGHSERFNRAYIDARKAIDENHVGVPRFASASRLSPLHLNDPGWTLGVLDTAVHDIDIMLWLIGDRPVAVAANGVRVNPDLSIFDHVTYQIHFADGALAQGHVGWVKFGDGYPMSGNAHPRLFIAGTAGTLSLDLWQRPVAVDNNLSGAYFWPDDVLTGYGDYFTELTAQNYAFVRAVTEGKPLSIMPAEAYQAVRVAHAARESLTRNNGSLILLD